MKKALFTFVVVMLVLCGCNKSKTFNVTLNFDNADGQTFTSARTSSYFGHYMLDLMKEEIDFELEKELAAGLTNESVYRQNVQKFIESGGQSTRRMCCPAQ